MAKMNWSRVRRRAPAPISLAETLAREAATIARRAKRKKRSPRGHFPTYVTSGVNADGSLRVRVFRDRAGADAAGYSWVGR